MKTKLLGVVAALTLFSGVCPASAEGFVYNNNDGTYVPFNVPPPGTGTLPFGINNNGQIVGQYGTDAGTQAFYYNAGGFTTLTVPGSRTNVATGINDVGQIVGQYVTPPSFLQGYLYSGGSFTTISAPSAISTQPQDINNSSQIVGTYLLSGSTRVGFIYNNGAFTSLSFPGATWTFADGINNLGQVVGRYTIGSSSTYHGYLYSAGTYMPLDFPFPGNGTLSGFLDINDAGQIIGSFTSESEQGFIFSDMG